MLKNAGFAPIAPNQLWSFRIKPTGQDEGNGQQQQHRLDLPLPMMGKGNEEKAATNQSVEGGIFGESKLFTN
jgi:hypothetical protein